MTSSERLRSSRLSLGARIRSESAAVGPFAVDEGLVQAVEPITSVRVFNTNSQKGLTIHTPVKDGKAVVSGDYQIDGVPGRQPRSACT